jgi:hypothetical protein
VRFFVVVFVVVFPDAAWLGFAWPGSGRIAEPSGKSVLKSDPTF